MTELNTKRALIFLIGFVLVIAGIGVMVFLEGSLELFSNILILFGGWAIGYVQGAEDADAGDF